MYKKNFVVFMIVVLFISTFGNVGSFNQSTAEANDVDQQSFRFDFGTGPVAEGYTQVTNTMVYDSQIGYGIDKNVAERDRGAPDDLRRDFILDGDYEFMVDIPDGEYFVRIIAGDDIAFNRTGFTVEGEDQGNNSSSAGEYAELTTMTTVSDEQLNIDIRENGRINGLEIIPMSELTGLEVESKSLGIQESVSLTWDDNDAAVSYQVYRKAESEETFSKIGSSDTNNYTDETVELGYSYTYAVTLVNEQGIESSNSNEVKVDMFDESVTVPAAPGNLEVEDATDESVSISWSDTGEAIKYYVYRSRFEDDGYSKIGVTEESAFTDDSILTFAHYYYKVRAVNEGGLSEYSQSLESPIVAERLRQMEKLNRAPVAVDTEDGIYVGWKMLGTDPQEVSFDLYRDGEKINDTPITESTNYLDEGGTVSSTYQVQVNNGSGESETETFEVWNEQFSSIPLDKPEGGTTPDGVDFEYSANDASVGDVNGDGNYEVILKWNPSNAKDNSRPGYTGNVYIDAYTLEGERLWRIDAGKNIRAGAHYTQFLVYDFDGNGKSEVVIKTADGTVDGQGTVIGDADADHRNSAGYILEGDEFLTIFDGETGAALDTIDYNPPRGNVNDWGDGYGNRVDRFLAGVAYLDGESPSIVMARGYYTRAVLATYDFKDGKLQENWVFDSDEEGIGAYAGQGNHSLSINDVDGDSYDEIVYGASVIDHDGTGLYSTGWGHGDAAHVSDLNPNRSGLEIFQPHESSGSPVGYGIRDAETGDLLWGVETGSDVGRGLAADIDPRYDGAELWASDSWDGSSGGSGLFSVEGERITDKSPASINHAVWWTGDLLRELLDHDFAEGSDTYGVGRIDKWNWESEQLENVLTPEGTRTSNGTKGNPTLQADLYGDWREEVIWASADSEELRIYTTTDVTEERIFTLMHDPTYRLGVAWQNVAYNQPPHTGFFLGHGMETPSMPAITTGDEASFANLTSLTEEYVLANSGKKGKVNGFLAKVNEAKSSDEKGNIKARNNQLGAFINHVEAQTGKALTEEQAEVLINMAHQLQK
ncbi:fibronectin type III domain-containing protein [Salipaludibacillus sp. CF4.18]|uniref:rhamnogalacturonan lyase family protein n=1 Tax=Salipaludibacillus sp. CF4.18 TaxID=3373081 RepID=UPI003EE5702C